MSLAVRAWLAVLVAGAATYAMRASLIVLLRDRTVPPVLEKAFRYVAPSVMAAIAVPGLLAPTGAVDLTTARVPAALVAGLVAWRWGGLLPTLVAGLGTFTLVSLL